MSQTTYQKRTTHNNARRFKDKGTSLKRASVVILTIFACLLPCLASAQNQQCIHANPTVLITPATKSGIAGDALTYTITVTNNDSADCPASTFEVQPSFPEDGFRQTPKIIRFTLRPGESGSRNVLVIAPGASCMGPKTFRETAINRTFPGFSGFADATLEVTPIVPDCGRANPTLTVTPVTTNAAAAGDQLIYRVTVTNNDNPGCGSSVFKITSNLANGLSQSPKSFYLLVPEGGSATRNVIVRSDLFASGDLLFTITATHGCATCLSGSEGAVFAITRSPSPTKFCCEEGFPETTILGDRGGKNCVIKEETDENGQPATCGGLRKDEINCSSGYGRDPSTGDVECN